ncbi:SDR family NAD(P)-dependent oxidoreductase [Nocardia sp. NPDC050175]|uniref:SDR family NAD(P)-dependent oxidoreductase n=1 Tax=Nocardia sp. NPDC050175 TaxID=3364317 RepID=UPI0037993E39
MKPFYPSIAVVTGAGSGIGRGTAKALAAVGAEVVVADIDLDSAQDAVAEIRRLGGLAVAYRLDVADTAALEDFGKEIRSTYGVPDVVVNNAGILVGGPFLDVPMADLRRIIDINLMAMIHGCRIFGAQMVERGRGGHLVNVASMAAFAAAPYTAPYSISKYAVKHFSECLRAELVTHQIGVTAVCPGLIATNLSATARMSSVLDEERSSITRKTMLKGQALLGMHPDKAGRIIVRAIRRNVAVEPIRLEARISYPLARWFPGPVRALMTAAAKPDIHAAVEDNGLLDRLDRLADRVPFRADHGVDNPADRG